MLTGNTVTINAMGCQREIQNQSRYYISSLEEAEKINQAVRRHWGIENKLHWVLDVVFNEDKQRSRTMFTTQNQAIINKVAVNLIKKNKTAGSISLNRKAAGWSKERLIQC